MPAYNKLSELVENNPDAFFNRAALFPALALASISVINALIGSLDCLRLFWLARKKLQAFILVEPKLELKTWQLVAKVPGTKLQDI